jgi:hypothetical protein
MVDLNDREGALVALGFWLFAAALIAAALWLIT